MKSLMKPSLILVVIFLAAFGCSKDENKQPAANADEQAAVDLNVANVTAENYYNDVFSEILQANADQGLNQPSGMNEVFGCATVTVESASPGSFPKIVTVDYGADGCTYLGVTRKGKLVYSITDYLHNPGAYVSVSFQNYSVNGYKLEGIFSITNNTDGANIRITTQTTAGRLTYPNGTYYDYEGSHNWDLTGGANTISITDDEYTITGGGTLTSSTGNTLSSSIQTGLVHKFSCANIVSGSTNLTYNNIQGVLDFGTGDCDKKATLTINNKVFQVTLP